MNKILTAVILICIAFQGHAQSQFVKQLFILNEGRFDYTTGVQTQAPSIGVYNVVTKNYQLIDIIPNSQFTTDALLDNGFLYVAADNKILKYNADNYALVGTIAILGVRKLAIWNNQLIATRGNYLTTYTEYVKIFDKNSLQLIYSLSTQNGPQWATEGVVIKNNTAYLAVGNAFEWGNYKGIVGALDLTTHSYGNEITLAGGATNPENLMLVNDEILTLNNNDFTNSSITKINTNTNTNATTTIVTGTGCATSTISKINNNDLVLFQAFGDNQLGVFDVNTTAVTAPININKGIYGIASNPLNSDIATGVTDFVSYGKIYIHNSVGVATDSFNVNLSPGTIVYDVRTSQANGINNNSNIDMQILPNPTTNNFTITGSNAGIVSITDVLGKTVLSQNFGINNNIIYTESLKAGVYFVTINVKGNVITKKLVKQ